MDCNLIKDKLLDYIDGILEKEEKNLVRDHLEQCDECNIEYNELKSTIDYIKVNTGNIDTKKVIDLNLKKYKLKPIRKIRRTILIAAMLSIILVMTAIATDNLGFVKWWQKYSEPIITSWENLLDNGVGDKLDISVIDKDIKITAEGIIADELNTVIFIRIEDLKGNRKFGPSMKRPDSLKIGGDVVNIHEEFSSDIEIPPMVNYSALFTEEENVAIVKIITEVLTSDKGNVDIFIDSLSTFFNENEESVVTINGNWNLKIPARKIKSKTQELNQVVNFKGNELLIENITIAPTGTNIKYRLKRYNEKYKYYIDNVDFAIEYNSNKYGYSPFNSSFSNLDNNAYLDGNTTFDSLYLENPEEIKLVIESYSYDIREEKAYDIDANNLPQVLKYKGSKITIEDIIYNEDNTEIKIKEDNSGDRRYLKSNFSIKVKDRVKNSGYIADHYTITDFKHKEVGIFRKINYRLADKVEIGIRPNIFRMEIVGESPRPTDLIPDKLYIEGQRYIIYPNKKVTIKLK